MANLEKNTSVEVKPPNEDISSFSYVNFSTIKNPPTYDSSQNNKDAYAIAERFLKAIEQSAVTIQQKIELSNDIEPKKRQARKNIVVGAREDGDLFLSSWNISMSFKLYENDTHDRFAIDYKGVRFPISSLNHGIQLINLSNSIMHSSKAAFESLGNSELLILSRDASPVKIKGDSLIFKGTMNDVILYSGSGSFLPPGFAEAIAATANKFINNGYNSDQKK